MEAEIRSWPAPVLDLNDNGTLRRLLLGKIDEVDALSEKVGVLFATVSEKEAARLAAEEERDVANQDFLQTASAMWDALMCVELAPWKPRAAVVPAEAHPI